MDKVVIIGAGPAGVRAAEVLVSAGLRPIVIDEAQRSGGQIYRRPPAELRRDMRALYGFEATRAARLHAAFDALKGRVDYRAETSVWSCAGQRLDLIGPSGPQAIEWDRIIIATGAMDRILPVPGWDLPGVFTLGGAQVSLKGQGCAVGTRPIFAGTGALLYLVAYQYLKAGVRPAAIVDTSAFADQLRALPGLLAGRSTFAKGLYYVASLRLAGVPVFAGAEELSIVRTEEQGLDLHFRLGKAARKVSGDALALGFGLRSETQLADLCELGFEFDAIQRQWLPKVDEHGRGTLPGTYLAGDAAKVLGADAAELTGRRAGLAVLMDLGFGQGAAEIQLINRKLQRYSRFRAAMETGAFAPPVGAIARCDDRLMICRCEAVDAGTLRAAVSDLGQRDVNRVKAITRVGMGRCQGRVCHAAASEIVAAAAGVPLASVGHLRTQAPIKPVGIGQLAARGLV